MRLSGALALLALWAAVPLQAQRCTDPQTSRMIECLRPIAAYTQSMIRDDRTQSPLRAGVSRVYANIQRAWTGPWRYRRYVRTALFWPAVAIFAYVTLVWITRHVFPPRYPVGKPPHWPAERFILIAMPILILLAFAAERLIVYQQMNEAYARTAVVVGKYVHLSPPALLASASTDPCHYAYSDAGYEPFAALCAQPQLWEMRITPGEHHATATHS
jgi:hypothetical protein